MDSLVQTTDNGEVGPERSDEKCLASGFIYRVEPIRFTGNLPWGEKRKSQR